MFGPFQSLSLSFSLGRGGIATVNRGKRRARIYIYTHRERERIERLFLIAHLTDYDRRLIATDDLKSDLRQRFVSGGRMSHRSGYFESIIFLYSRKSRKYNSWKRFTLIREILDSIYIYISKHIRESYTWRARKENLYICEVRRLTRGC